MKKIVCLLIVLTLSLSVIPVFASEESSLIDQEQSFPGDAFVDETMEMIDDGQNPVMNFIGSYVCDRARMEVMPEGDDSAKITVTWGGSAFECAQWTMSGVFDSDTLEVSCSDCTKKIITYDRDSEETDPSPDETVEYTDGSCKVIFGEDGTLIWEDSQEHIADGMVFEYIVNVDPGQTKPMPGGWENVPHEAEELPEDAQEAFDKAAEELDDAEYIPVALLSTQLDAGMNYCILCQITTAGADAKTSWALVYIYADLDGNVEITNVYELYIPLHSTP